MKRSSRIVESSGPPERSVIVSEFLAPARHRPQGPKLTTVGVETLPEASTA
jgi:hypothetical protein